MKSERIKHIFRAVACGMIIGGAVAVGNYFGNTPEQLQESYPSLSVEDAQKLRENTTKDLSLSTGALSVGLFLGVGRKRNSIKQDYTLS